VPLTEFVSWQRIESEDSWVLEESVEMSLDDEDANIYREYP